MSDISAAVAATETVVPPADAPEVQDTHADPEVTSRAQRMGWRPKEEWRGDQSRWVDASTFVERGESELPVLRERYRALDDRAARSERLAVEANHKVEELTTRLGEAAGVMTELRTMSLQAEERAYRRARAEYEAQMNAAVQTADTIKYSEAKQQLDALETSRAAPPPPPARVETRAAPPQAPPSNPVIDEWLRENTWFNTDGRGDTGMTAYASARHAELTVAHPGMTERDRLDEVRSDVTKRFPEKFENTRRAAPAAVSAPSAPPARSGKRGKSVSDLPVEAKAALARFKKQMPDYKDEDYLKVYFAGEES